MDCGLPGGPGGGLDDYARPSVFRSSVPMRQIRDFMQHMFNPLHVYCRLKDLGVAAPTAHRVTRAYERLVWRRIW
ncbi:hypothetical protein NY78_2912 [Desulfovibrio sp. TomC]|nr:hypothetical protein NY78_2912 [Desulfovibrio sp. TomC]